MKARKIRPSSGLCLLVLLAACTPRPPATDFQHVQAQAFTQTDDTPLGKATGKLEAGHKGLSGIYLVPENAQAFLLRIGMAEAAQKSIDLQYYDNHDDTTGCLLQEALLRAADRGVRVRMLLDNWNLDDFKAGVVALDAHPNIEIRVFNPLGTRNQNMLDKAGELLAHSERFLRRMHNKTMIADNQAAIVGGRNLGDEYFGWSANYNFRDLDVFSIGAVVPQVSASFDRYWNSAQAYPVHALDLPKKDASAVRAIRSGLQMHWTTVQASSLGKRLYVNLPDALAKGTVPLTWAQAELAADNPAKIEREAGRQESKPAQKLNELVAGAHKEFLAITPYFIPLDEGVDGLKELVKRGVSVRILTNSLASTDVLPVQGAYKHYREELLDEGVELYEFKPLQKEPGHRNVLTGQSRSALHAKVYVIDRQILVVGSFNLDPRSVRNTEQVMVIHSPELAESVAKRFERAVAPSESYHVIKTANGINWIGEEKHQSVRYTSDPQASLWRRLTAGIVGLLPVDDQL